MTNYQFTPDGLAQLYTDLRDHYGTANETVPWIYSTHWLNMALAELDTLYTNEDWDAVIQLALEEHLDISKYCELA